MKEVEMKAWVTELSKSRIQEFLETKCVYVGKKDKYDIMYTKKGERKMEFRLREENNVCTITRKKREYSSTGMEINEELEFPVMNKQDFTTFVQQGGFEIMYVKNKNVEQYTYNNILLEYVIFEKLGQFLEVEIVCEEEDSKYAARKIESLFVMLAIESDIEKAPYGKLLGEF